jgi:putative aldouronate transport system substrate-binding protein
MNRNMRIAAMAMCLVLLVGVLGGCAGTTTTTTPTSAATDAPATTAAAAATQAPEATGEATADAGLTLPYDETLVIRYWQVLGAKYVKDISSFEEMPFFRYMEEKMNVDFQWAEPSEDVATEQFGLMIAAGNWPDVIQGVNRYYPGGLNSAYEDGIIIEMNEYIEGGYTPWIKKIYETFPQYAQQALWNGTQYLDVPYFRNDGNLFNEGLMLRKDLLDKYGFEIPETIADFEALLYAMKDWEEVEIPFSTIGMGNANASGLIAGTGVTSGWDLVYNEYQDAATHEVRYGAVQPEFKEIVTMLNKWYVDGILDPDFVTNDSAAQNAKVAEGIVGVWYGAGGGNGNTPWMSAIDADPNTSMVAYGIRPVSKEAGKDPVVARCSFNYNPDQSGCVTTTCQNIEKVLFAMDYMGYSDEGRTALMYGEEGINYTVAEDGRINIFEDVNGSAQPMTEKGDEDSFDPKWTTTSGPYFSGIVLWDTAEFLHQEDPKVYVQRWYSDSDTSVETYKAKCSATRRGEWIPNWKSYDPVNNMPYVTYNTEESALRAELNTAIDTYVVETLTAFILGTQDIEAGWDAYVEEVYDLGLQDLLDLYQSKVDAYYAG